jgi:ABC-type multidrug transport system fused ATPase/permease subunit
LERSLNCEFQQVRLNFWLMMRMSLASSLILTAILFGSVSIAMFLPERALTSGTVGLLLAYLLVMLGRQDRLFRDVVSFGNVLIPWERCMEWAGLPKEEPDPDPKNFRLTECGRSWPTSGEITFEDVQIRYHSDLPVIVKSAKFHIASGEHVGLAGRSGAGKSTLFLALLRAIPIDRGDIKIDGVSIMSVPLVKLRRSIAYVPQEPQIFLGPLRDSIDIFSAFTNEQIHEVMDRVGLGGFLAGLPAGLATEIHEDGKNVSAGQRQLICLARALLMNAHIVLMDEATASVDPETDSRIQMAIQKYFAATTVLLIAHRPSSLKDCEKVIYVDQGEARVSVGGNI